MAPVLESNDDYARLVARLKTLLPETYRDTYEDVQPRSMGSAGLKYDEEGRVAWNQIWGSFCDLAMAGGPPHRGRLLEPATRAEIDLHPDRYDVVIGELCRGVKMVTGLAAEPSSFAGWIDVDCSSATAAEWLARAINMENVSAHADGIVLHLPAGPQFRLEKEIKNVVVSIAKTCHYWTAHHTAEQQQAIAELFSLMEGESPLLQPAFARNTSAARFEELREKIAADIFSGTGLQAPGREYYGWLGIDCPTVRCAIWTMRMMAASNVMARREDHFLYVPVNPTTDRSGGRCAGFVAQAFHMARSQAEL